MTKKINPKFQSYVVIGENNEEEITQLANEFNIELSKPSPDITILSPEKKSISIDLIRELKKHISQKPVSLPHKLVIVKKAHTLTKSAQNSLLKLFEEPPRHAVIILEAHHKSSLLPTILSRAIVIRTQPQAKIDEEKSSLLATASTSDLIEEIANVEEPSVWLDNQINSLHQSLLSNIKSEKTDQSVLKIQSAIEKCAEAKKMIEANVNAKFVLANLIFSMHTDVQS